MAGETESTTPESVDVAGAVALMGDLAKDVREREKGGREPATAPNGGEGENRVVPEADKGPQVNWTALAEKNPAEWARLNQIRMDEAAVLAEANRRGQQDVQAATARAEQAFQHAKHVEHAKLVQKLPDYFGAPETSQK